MELHFVTSNLAVVRLSADMRTQVSCPPLFFAELQKKTENMRKIQSLEGTKWRYDTIGY